MPEPSTPYSTDAIPAPRPSGSGAVDQSIVIWRALAELGLRDVVVAPGSRSAPLVYALATEHLRHRIQAHVRIDERAAAFTALGISRHDPAHPAAVITTSGTAAAHLLAAVMEAHHSRIPLLVITADRPAELRGTGANQTTWQTALYSDFVRQAADLPAPAAGAATIPELRTAANTAARALAAATGDHPGPVHLNLGFRDPLVPSAAGGERPDEHPGRIVLTRRASRSRPVACPVPISDATVVVAGDGAGRAASDLARIHHLPLLAEPSSGARDSEQLITGYPALLRQIMAERDHPLRPDRAIVYGHPTLSRPVLGALLGADDVDVIVVDPYPDWADAARRARLVVPAAAADPPTPAQETMRQATVNAWKQAAARIVPATPGHGDWQRQVALAVWDATETDDVLLLGSSSLIRDLELHAGTTRGRILANRGLAGIDGTTSTAVGLALARRHAEEPLSGRVRLLVGDLTALHDMTGVIIGPEELRPDLDVIVVDDGGGRIFSGLEHAAAPPDLLRRFFTTPHGTDIAAAAAALGAEARIVTPEAVPGALAATPRGIRVLVVQEPSSALPGNVAPDMVG